MKINKSVFWLEMALQIEVSPEMCRICLKSDLVLNFSVKDCEEMVRNVAQVELPLFESEEMPNKVCNPCYQKLFLASDIRNLCLESHRVFLEYLKALEEEKPKPLFRCCFCGLEFGSEEGLLEHAVEIHEMEALERENEACPVCKVFCGDNFETHRTCQVCSEYLEGDEELEEHSIQHAERYVETEIVEEEVPQEFWCCRCPFVQSERELVVSHFSKVHSDEVNPDPEPGELCYLCQASFKTLAELEAHSSASRSEPKQSSRCNLCQLTFQTPSRLKTHCALEHPGEALFACDECDKTYAKPESLRNHKYIQHRTTPFHCSICNKSFNRKKFFTDHMNAHNGIKPYRCSVCDASFARNNNLTQHMRKHTGEKKYRCRDCDKAYAHLTDLRRHSYTHSENWPFSCPTCGKGFGKKNALSSHLATHTDRSGASVGE